MFGDVSVGEVVVVLPCSGGVVVAAVDEAAVVVVASVAVASLVGGVVLAVAGAVVVVDEVGGVATLPCPGDEAGRGEIRLGQIGWALPAASRRSGASLSTKR